MEQDHCRNLKYVRFCNYSLLPICNSWPISDRNLTKKTAQSLMSKFWACNSAIIETQLFWYKRFRFMLGQTAALSMARPEKKKNQLASFITLNKGVFCKKNQVYLHHLAHHKSIVNICCCYHLILSRADVLQISLWRLSLCSSINKNDTYHSAWRRTNISSQFVAQCLTHESVHFKVMLQLF